MTTFWTLSILGAVLYAIAVYLLLRFNFNAHAKPTPKRFDIHVEEAKWRTR